MGAIIATADGIVDLRAAPGTHFARSPAGALALEIFAIEAATAVAVVAAGEPSDK
jgi:hypothetical protein